MSRVKPSQDFDTRSINDSLSRSTDLSNFVGSNYQVRSPVIPKPLRAVTFFDASEPIKEEEKKIKVAKQKPKQNPFKSFIIFIFGNFGIIFLAVVYAIIGAILFKTLEQHQALADCQAQQSDSKSIMNKYTIKLYNYLSYNVTFNPPLQIETYGNNTEIKDGPEIYNAYIRKTLEDLRDQVLENGFDGDYTEEYCKNIDPWEFWNSLLLTVTIISTIGYGHLSPKSWEGQLVLICYGLLGVPIFLMCLAKISRLLADLFILLYKHIICCPFSFYTVLKKYRNNEFEIEDEEDDDEPEVVEDHGDPFKMAEENREGDLIVVDEFTEQENEDITSVPIVLVFSTMFIFIIAGAYLFHWLEGWSIISSGYFVFISMSTIGFGDYTPGIAAINDQHHNLAARNLIVGIIYIVLGMSLLGMSISLLQEGAVDNVIGFLKAIHILKDGDEEEVSEDIEITEIVNLYHDDSESDEDEKYVKNKF